MINLNLQRLLTTAPIGLLQYNEPHCLCVLHFPLFLSLHDIWWGNKINWSIDLNTIYVLYYIIECEASINPLTIPNIHRLTRYLVKPLLALNPTCLLGVSTSRGALLQDAKGRVSRGKPSWEDSSVPLSSKPHRKISRLKTIGHQIRWVLYSDS